MIDIIVLDDCRSNAHGRTYTGIINYTVSGRTCQHWNVQTPHR